MSHVVRRASVDDSAAILDIYSYYIKNTAVTFETEVPNLDEFCGRVKAIVCEYPYIVYEIDNMVVGYAYASRHRERSAYCYDADLSVYVMEKYHGLGIAVRLYERLLSILYKQGFYNAYAGITIPNEKSVNFHRKFGSETIGIFRKTGYKLGKWHDVLHMGKAFREHDDYPNPIKFLADLDDGLFSRGY